MAVVVAFSACDALPWAEKAPPEAEAEVAAAVEVRRVDRGSLQAVIEASSTIQAERQVTVHAETTGRLVELRVEEGDTIEPGKRIARIQADAQAAGLDRAHTQLEQARRDLETVERLFERKVASQDELERARLLYDNATLDVRDRRRDVGNAVVTAPFRGTVTERRVAEGAFVTAGEPLLGITDFSSLVARVYLPEKQLDRVSVGQAALVSGKAVRGRQGQGTVVRIAPIVDSATGTVKVTVALPDQDETRTFLPGMYAEIRLTTDRRENVLRIPKRAVLEEDGQRYAFVAAGERARRVTLELGLADGDWFEVLEGLAEGAEVIVAGHAGLKHDALIRRVDANGHTMARSEVPSAPGGA